MNIYSTCFRWWLITFSQWKTVKLFWRYSTFHEACLMLLQCSWRPRLMSNNSVTRLVGYQMSVLSNITHFKVWVKAGDNVVIFSDTVNLLHPCIPACTRMCRQTLRHLHWVSQRALHHCQWYPGALWLVAGWWMSLPWAALLKRLSIRLQSHGPSHLIRSQWKPVAPCHHSYSTGTRCNRDSHWSTELDTLRKPFRCKERILCDSCTTLSHMGGAALGWRGEIVWGRGVLTKSRMLFSFFVGYVRSKRLIQDSINQIAHRFF